MQANYFEQFRRLLPATNLQVWEDEMIYYFTNATTAKYFEALALEIILENGFPLVAVSETWASDGIVHQRSMRVTMAPEEELISA